MQDEMREQYSRTRLLLGQAGLDRLRAARVAVFGVGGVGGYVVEALARSGVGALDLIDDDRVCLSNLNRQVQLCGGRHRHRHRQAVPGHAGKGGGDAHHLLHGGGQQAGPQPL